MAVSCPKCKERFSYSPNQKHADGNDGLWRTKELLIQRVHDGNFRFSLIDDSLYHTLKDTFPGIGEPIRGKPLGTIAHILAELYGALDSCKQGCRIAANGCSLASHPARPLVLARYCHSPRSGSAG